MSYQHPFPIDPYQTTLTLAYRNTKYIADLVLPRKPVGKTNYDYFEYSKEEVFTIADTKVGRRGQPNEVDLTVLEKTGSVRDYGLDSVVPQADIDNAPEKHNPISHATMMLTDNIMLDREKRVADLIFNPTTYATGNTLTLSGTDQWSDYTNSKPVDDIVAARDALFFRPNKMVVSRQVLSVLVRHPQILKAAYGPLIDDGYVRAAQLAEALEFDEVLIGEAWFNPSKKGQPLSMQRVWSNHCALLWIDKELGGPKGHASFGFTAEYGERIAGSMPDARIGLRGGQRVRVGESVDEKVSCPDLGFLFEDCIA